MQLTRRHLFRTATVGAGALGALSLVTPAAQAAAPPVAVPPSELELMRAGLAALPTRTERVRCDDCGRLLGTLTTRVEEGGDPIVCANCVAELRQQLEDEDDDSSTFDQDEFDRVEGERDELQVQVERIAKTRDRARTEVDTLLYDIQDLGLSDRQSIRLDRLRERLDRMAIFEDVG